MHEQLQDSNPIFFKKNMLMIDTRPVLGSTRGLGQGAGPCRVLIVQRHALQGQLTCSLQLVHIGRVNLLAEYHICTDVVLFG